MSYLSDISFRRGIGLLILMLAILSGGTWAIVKITIDHLLYQNATMAARDWAQYLSQNAADLEQIAAGEQPSAASMVFFRAARNSGPVFRYEIFNREGYSQIISEYNKIALVDVSEFSVGAARAIESGQPIVDVQQSHSADLPRFFASISGGSPSLRPSSIKRNSAMFSLRRLRCRRRRSAR
jgi:hypothetical protein